MAKCEICSKSVKKINRSHIKSHDGILIQGNKSRQAYIIENGCKRHVISPVVMSKLGKKSSDVNFYSQKFVNAIPEGEEIR